MFIVKVYAPFWFLVKSHPQSINGSRHIFINYIVWIRELSQHIQEIIRPVIEHNSYFHPENVLIAMITDSDASIRYLGYEKNRINRIHTDDELVKYQYSAGNIIEIPGKFILKLTHKFIFIFKLYLYRISMPLSEYRAFCTNRK